MKRFNVIIAATVISACMLVGCASILEVANGSLSGLVITQATARYIERAERPGDRVERALAVQRVAAEVRAAAENGEVSVASLRALAESQLPPDMEISDRLLAAEVINVVALELERKLGSGVLVEADLPSLDALLRRIEFAAAYYV